jgi:hypothetical protein
MDELEYEELLDDVEYDMICDECGKFLAGADKTSRDGFDHGIWYKTFDAEKGYGRVLCKFCAPSYE